MLWLWPAHDALPPDVSSCLERLTAPAIALTELARLDPRGVYLLDPAAWIVVRELVADMSRFGRASVMCVP